MRSKRHTSFTLALSFLFLTIRSVQSWAPASSPLQRVAPVGLRRSFLARSGQSQEQNFNRYVQVRGGTGNNDDVESVQEEIRASFEASRLESSPDLEVPVGFVLHTDRPEPSADELSNENMLRIILSMCTDEEVNELVWKCLGYRRVTDNSAEEGEWDATECFPKWRDRFPTPPDLVGITRTYTKEVDGPVLKANQALVRTVPMAYKQSIREHVSALGSSSIFVVIIYMFQTVITCYHLIATAGRFQRVQTGRIDTK